MADEPTGNLDPDTAADVLDLLLKPTHGAGLAAVIATRNRDFAGGMDRAVRLVDAISTRA